MRAATEAVAVAKAVAVAVAVAAEIGLPRVRRVLRLPTYE